MSDEMRGTEDRLGEIADLWKDTTAAPWMRNGKTAGGLWRNDGSTERIGLDFIAHPVVLVPGAADAEAIAHAPEDIAFLLAAYRAAHARVTSLEAQTALWSHEALAIEQKNARVVALAAEHDEATDCGRKLRATVEDILR